MKTKTKIAFFVIAFILFEFLNLGLYENFCYRAPKGLNVVYIDKYFNHVDTVVNYEFLDDVDTLDEWQIMMMAIIEQESRYERTAKSGEQYGYMQITPIFVKEANSICNDGYKVTDGYNLERTIDMFNIINDKYNPERSITKAIHNHNSKAGAQYIYEVKQRMNNIKKYEKVRKKLLRAYERCD